MPSFRAWLKSGGTVTVSADDPTEARKTALLRTGHPVAKIKLDRETVTPAHRAPRLTRRELRGDVPC